MEFKTILPPPKSLPLSPISPLPLLLKSSFKTQPKPPLQKTLKTHPKLHLLKPIHRKPIETKPPERKISIKNPASASDVLRLMDSLGISIPVDMYSSFVEECSKNCDPVEALELHNHINRSRIRPSLSFLNEMLIMHVRCRCIEDARQVFDRMPRKDYYSWAAMFAAYAMKDEHERVVCLFVDFVRMGYMDCLDLLGFPVSRILGCVLKACVHSLDIDLAKQIHGLFVKRGYAKDLFLSSSLVDIYGKLGCMDDAELLFSQASGRNVVVSTSRIVNYCKEERFDAAAHVFREMGLQGVRRNSFTFSSVLRACAKMGDDGRFGRQVHAQAIKLGLASESYVQCGLVNMYGKFGLIQDAKRVFEMNESERNTACWNAMLATNVQHGFLVEAIKVVYQMKAAGVQPRDLLLNEVSLVCGGSVLGNKIANRRDCRC